MTHEELSRGNLLYRDIIDAKNKLRDLKEWYEIIEKQDEMVWISSKEEPGRRTKSICVLHGKKVLPFIQERIKEVEEMLREMRSNFEKL